MSEVFCSPGPTLEEALGRAHHVVKVAKLHRTELFKEVTFPKETAFNGKASDYSETVDLYQVIRVLHSTAIQPGQVIRVWKEPDYGESLARCHHETGMSVSPIVARYAASHAPRATGPVLLILDDMEESAAGTYRFLGAEAPASEAEIHRLLIARPQ